MARQLVHVAKTGTLPEKGGGAVALPDRLKAWTAVLDRGGAPPRTEVTGADGAPFTIAVRAAVNGD